jgi:2-polyprenyl-6-methoxyphenol hydroxylase-like FAD-dependent oxidoreductase
MSTTAHPLPESASSRIGVRPHAPRRRALVVGLGVAGLAAAIRLSQTEWEVVMVERAAARRGGGYMIGLFGIGQAAAKRMGLLEAMGDRHDPHGVSYEVDRAGRRHPGIGFPPERG